MKGNRKVSPSARVAKYIGMQKSKLLYQWFVVSKFKYCPLIWIFCGKTSNDNIDRVHKQTLGILLYDHKSTLVDLLAKKGKSNVHTQNLCVLLIDVRIRVCVFNN